MEDWGTRHLLTQAKQGKQRSDLSAVKDHQKVADFFGILAPP
jgi:hypothetical protein